MRNRAILALIIVTSLVRIYPDVRSGGIDFVVIIDTSLSMAPTMAEAKRYAAGEIVGRLVERGDWLCVVRFYEKSEIVWSGDIATDTDIAKAVRSLNLLKADGRFTDIGVALDTVDRLLVERAHPERPKYVVLITDERQEAPKGSEYYSTDYTISHPALEYVKRLDLGGFRAITIGYGLAARVEGGSRALLTTLSSPPESAARPLAGANAAASGDAGAAESAADGGSKQLNGPESASAIGDATIGGVPIRIIAISGGSIAIVAAIGVLIAAYARRSSKRRRDDEKPHSPDEGKTEDA